MAHPGSEAGGRIVRHVIPFSLRRKSGRKPTKPPMLPLSPAEVRIPLRFIESEELIPLAYAFPFSFLF